VIHIEIREGRRSTDALGPTREEKERGWGQIKKLQTIESTIKKRGR